MRSKQLAFITVMFATAVTAAQNASFGVASVKPQTEFRCCASHSGNRYYEPSAFLRRVVEFAYNLPPVRIVGGPDWIDSDLWAIDARAAVPAGADEMRSMVRQLLADRFKLTARFETRELPIYELQLARQDGELGPKARPAADCEPIGKRSREDLRAAGVRVCTAGIMAGAEFVRWGAQGAPMSALARHLEGALKRVVTDHTRVDGLLDMELTYAWETGLPAARSLAALAKLPEAPALSTALREQLGLKLEEGRGPVDVLVIGSVERPTPD
jgi:uncharacterized protein (TIGR03435 family)